MLQKSLPQRGCASNHQRRQQPHVTRGGVAAAQHIGVERLPPGARSVAHRSEQQNHWRGECAWQYFVQQHARDHFDVEESALQRRACVCILIRRTDLQVVILKSRVKRKRGGNMNSVHSVCDRATTHEPVMLTRTESAGKICSVCQFRVARRRAVNHDRCTWCHAGMARTCVRRSSARFSGSRAAAYSPSAAAVLVGLPDRQRANVPTSSSAAFTPCARSVMHAEGSHLIACVVPAHSNIESTELRKLIVNTKAANKEQLLQIEITSNGPLYYGCTHPGGKCGRHLRSASPRTLSASQRHCLVPSLAAMRREVNLPTDGTCMVA
jgi:hypothetical protein